MWQVEWLILWKMIVKMLTHIHMMVYTWKMIVKMSINSVMKRRREGLGTPPAPYKKRQGPIVWTGLWSRSDRTLGCSVRSVVAGSVQRRSIDRTLALEVTGRWLCASGQG